MKMRKTGLGALLLAGFLHLGSTEIQAAFIAGLNGTSNSSIFETGAITPLPAQGWTNVSGTARIFDSSTINGAIIGTTRYANYAVQYATAVPVAPETTYTLRFDLGFFAAATGGSANYRFEMGTLSGGTFTPLAPPETGTVAHAGNMSGGVVSASDTLVITTGSTVSGDPLAVRWAQTFQAGAASNTGSDFFGFDNVTLDATAVPEPSSALLLGGVAAAVLGRIRRRKLS